MRNWTQLLAVCALLSACAVPLRRHPAPQVRQLPALGTQATPGSWPQTAWWRVLGDRRLNRLMVAGLKANPSLAAAQTRLRSANAAVHAARAALGTSFAIDGSVDREKLSANGLFPPPLGGSSFTQSELSASASRQLDLWHQNRDLIEASVSARKAQEATVAEARLLLSRAIANAYFGLARDIALGRIRARALRRNRRLMQYAVMAYHAGAGNEQNVMIARAEVASARLSRDTSTAQVSRDRVMLAALLGRGPTYGSRIVVSAQLRVPDTALPPDLRLDLLARRPDITARYWTVRAAAAQVGAARAGFYPNVSLSAMGGLQSLTFTKLLSASSLMGSTGVAIHLPLFQPGTLKARLSQARADYDQAVDEYNHAVLTAARNVAADLVTTQALAREQQDLTDLQYARSHELAIAKRRYRLGDASIIPVLEAQNALADVQARQQVLTAARVRALIGLLGALGGGYQTAPL